MKQFMLTVASITIFLSATMAHAAPQKLPTRGQLIKLIKQTDRAGLGVTGLSSYKDCDEISLRSVKILKVGRASSNYYKEYGTYIDSGFMVKIKATGSCSFKHFHDFFSDIDNDGYDDRLSGTLPIINEPLQVRISTDEYGDWKAREINFAGTNIESNKIKQHIKKLFIKGKVAMGGKYTSRVVINNIRSGQGKGKYYKDFAVSNEIIKASDYRGKTNVQSTFGSNYRPADWWDLVKYSKINGNVLSLFNQLGIPAQKGVFVTERGSVGMDTTYIVHCSKFNSGKGLLPEQKLKTQPICLADSYRGDEFKFLAVKKSAYGEKPIFTGEDLRIGRHSNISYAPPPKLKPFNTNKNPSQPAMTKDKRMNEVFELFKKRPKAFKVFRKQSEDVRFRLFKSIYERKTKQERYRAFLNVANNLENGGKQRSTSGSNSHSHGGRVHTHKLPRLGKAHRHNNGAIGR